jgi:hypothetical protein
VRGFVAPDEADGQEADDWENEIDGDAAEEPAAETLAMKGIDGHKQSIIAIHSADSRRPSNAIQVFNPCASIAARRGITYSYH